ncbi:MAG: hypothetical protein ACOYJ1_01100 [Peptococcales bacterium]|jgi:hypothetical protein
MNNSAPTNLGIAAKISKGWKPNNYLTNLAVANFQPNDWFVAPFVFPIVPVGLSTSYFYKFNKADLARDNVQRKPRYGKVTPMLFGTSRELYDCEVDQVLIGIDQIGAVNYQRAGTPGINDPRRAKVRLATEQMAIHMDRMFGESYFKTGVWTNEWTGVASTPGTKEFLKFNDANFDPISFFDARKTEMMLAGRRKPNVLALGVEAYNALKTNPDILDRVKYSGSTANPATVNPNVIAQLLEIDRVVVLNSVYNDAGYGQEDMKFACDSKGALLAYAAPNAGIDEPSAGYTFTWDMLGNGQYLAFDQFDGEPGTHTEFIEGLVSYDHKKVCDELGVFMKQCA